MKTLLSHPTGNTFVRAAIRALHARGRLHSFHTTINAPPVLTRVAPARARRQMLRRHFTEVPRSLVHTYPWREAARLAAGAVGLHRVTGRGAWAGIDAVYQSFDRGVARRVQGLKARSVAAVYAYEDGAAATFRAASDLGIARVYELPIAHWALTQRLLREEAERLPAWRRTLRGLEDPPEKLARKTEELALAQVIVVPSRFVLESLPAPLRASRCCVVAPFGSPVPESDNERRAAPAGSRPLRVLFAGAMTQRKGLADLFAAMRLLKRRDVELVVMGSLLAPLSFYREQYPAFVYEAPRPHESVLSLMRTCDVLALPAIVEGRALVQQEALASGLPLLVTPNAGADDLVREGETGFVVPIRSPEVLAERIAWLADRRRLLPEMRRQARAVAAAHGWAAYEEAVLSAIERVAC